MIEVLADKICSIIFMTALSFLVDRFKNVKTTKKHKLLASLFLPGHPERISDCNRTKNESLFWGRTYEHLEYAFNQTIDLII